MRAVVCTRYGPPEVLELADIAKPNPSDHEVRIKVHATAVTSSDCLVRSFHLPWTMWIPARFALGLTKPRHRVPGMVVAGEIDAVGPAVTSFAVGDKVFGLDRFGFGAYAEYKCMPQDGVLARKPANLDYAQAAAIPYGGLLALHFLRKGGLSFRHKILVYGASGAVGSSAVQLAEHFGADVTAVCGPQHLELVKSLGANSVIDYTTTDFTVQGTRYDVILVAVGNRVHPPTAHECRRALTPHGAYVAVDQGHPYLPAADLTLLRQLAEERHLEPVIDRCYPLDHIVEAHEYVEQGHKAGNVIVTMTADAAE
ncbi:NAD(P)-dependent alcohol dehydrogenase [Nocardia sp. CDC153]|uniref:NAD(P)-dependent alcohol dehydrogenase n=1 Tax=Nocardia sp. CDC153 TaxID=3112167 RepID=UPI002DB761A3|nr:NAD(P)-dependent alcohol dehydrogenase [Nocardia sp. CDC153]MEC3952911.1 NAD(P)-dependent alcohol dehydrogenase [Nocardia sp. CDC153]